VTATSTRPPIEERSNGRLSTSLWKTSRIHVRCPPAICATIGPWPRISPTGVEIIGLTVGIGPFGKKPAGTFNVQPDPSKGHAYPAMASPSETLSTVTARFACRPTTNPDGTGPRRGWDVAPMTTTELRLRGRALAASAVDCWYPPNFTRTVRAPLSGGMRARQPGPATVAAATVSSTAPSSSYRRARPAALANQISPVVDGYYVDRVEISSDRGELLATGESLRCDENYAGGVRGG
jgi:hypothetical protein